MIELNDLEDLQHLDLSNFHHYEVKELHHSDEKWIKYFLSCEEIELMRRLRGRSDIMPTTDLFETNVGLVSGENSFFLLNQELVEKYHLAHATRTIIGKTDQLKGIILTKRDFSQLVENGRKVYMFAPKNVPLPKLSKEEQSYIKYGEEISVSHKIQMPDPQELVLCSAVMGAPSLYIKAGTPLPPHHPEPCQCCMYGYHS